MNEKKLKSNGQLSDVRKLTLQAQIVCNLCTEEKTTNYKVQVGKPIEQTE